MNKIFLILIFFSGFTIMNGQVDTLKQTKTNAGGIESNSVFRKQKYLDINLKNEPTLLKLGIRPMFYKYSKDKPKVQTFSLGLGFEQKIIPSISVLIENNVAFASVGSVKVWGLVGNVEVRCYPKINKRIREFTGANNFHSNYFSIGLNGIYAYVNFKGYKGSSLMDINEWSSAPDVTFAWGIQRKFGKFGYFDVAPYISIDSYGDMKSGARFQLGLGWGL